MKKFSSLVFLIFTVMIFTGCRSKPFYSNRSEVTLEKINDKTVPTVMSSYKGAAQIDRTVTAKDSEIKISLRYVKDKDIYKFCQTSAVGDEISTTYLSTDADDRFIYTLAAGEYYSVRLDDEVLKMVFDTSFTDYGEYSALVNVAEENGVLTAVVDTQTSGTVQTDTLTIDKQSGFVLSISSVIELGEYSVYDEFTYSDDKTIDESAKGGEYADAPLSFTTQTVSGETVTADTLFEGKKLIMVNFWEPWCSPCVKEMPRLQELYDNYKDKGLQIIGVYSTADGARDIVTKNSITYPIIAMCPEFSKYTSEYVPTTVFFDENGEYISDSQVIGAKSYSDWEDLVYKYLSSEDLTQ